MAEFKTDKELADFVKAKIQSASQAKTAQQRANINAEINANMKNYIETKNKNQ